MSEVVSEKEKTYFSMMQDLKGIALEIQSVALNLNYILIESPGPQTDETAKESAGPELLKHIISSTKSILIDTREVLYKVKQHIGS